MGKPGTWPVVLDTGATSSIFGGGTDAKFAYKLREPVTVKTVGGPIVLSEAWRHKVWGDGLYAQHLKFDLISWDAIMAEFEVKLDPCSTIFHLTAKQGHSPRAQWRAVRESGLFHLRPAEEKTWAMIASPAARDEEVWSFHERMGHAPAADLIRMAAQPEHNDLGLTASRIRSQHVERCPACVQGKMTARTPTGRATNSAELGSEIYADLVSFTVAGRGQVFVLLARESRSGYYWATVLEAKTSPNIFDSLMRFVGLLRSYKLVVRHLKTDSEANFKSLTPDLERAAIRTTFVPPGVHERRSERAIQTLRSNMQAIMAALNFAMPAKWFNALVAFTVDALNSRPNKNSFPKTPRELIEVGRPDSKQLKFALPFGARALAHRLAKNNVDGPTVDVIYLGKSDVHGHNGYRVVDIATKQIVTVNKVVAHDRHNDTAAVVQRMYGSRRFNLGRTALPLAREEVWPVFFPAQPMQSTKPTGVVTQPTTSAGVTVHATTPAGVIPQAHPEPSNSPSSPSSDEDESSSTDSSPEDEGQAQTPSLVPAAAAQTQTPSLPTRQDGVSSRGRKVRTDAQRRMMSHGTPHPKPPWRAAKPHPRRAHSANVAEVPFIPSHLKPLQSLVKLDKADEDAPQEYRGKFVDVTEEYFGTTAFMLKVEALDPKQRELMVAARVKEITKFLDHNALEPLNYATGQVLYSKLLMAEVRNTMGMVTGFKARLVMGGNNQKGITVDLATTNPAFEEMLVLIQLCVNEGLEITTMDVQNAFLHSPISSDANIRLPKEAADEFARLSEEFARHQRPDGTIVCKALRSIYGLRNGPVDFQRFVRGKLADHGFTPTKASASIYVRTLPSGKRDILYVFVDDILHAFPKGQRDVAFMGEFSGYTEHVGPDLEFLGIKIEVSMDGTVVTLTQPGYAKDAYASVLGENDKIMSDRPYCDNLMDPLINSPRLDAGKTKRFGSDVMKLMYLANRTRADTKLAVSYLSSRIAEPTEADWAKLVKLARYVKSTASMGITLRKGKTALTAEADASFGLFKDARAQIGHAIWMGNSTSGAILTVCKRGDAAMTSSTHAESTACYRAATDVVHFRNLLRGMGYGQEGPSRVAQDNLSNIINQDRGPGRGGKSRIYEIKLCWVSDLVHNGDIGLYHLPGTESVADGFTKPVLQSKFAAWRDRILGVPILRKTANIQNGN